MERMKRLLKEEDGQDIMEYVIIAAMISIVAIAMVKFTGIKLNGLWSGLNNTMW